MKRLFTYLSITLICAGCSEPIVSTFGSIGGTVQDIETGAFLEGVTVVLNPTGYSQVTNENGAFQYDNLDIAEYTLTFSKKDYETQSHKVTVKPGLVSNVQVTLSKVAATLSVEPTTLNFGSKMTERDLVISASFGSVSYRLKAENKWINLSKTSGTVTDKDYVTVVVSRSGLSPASYDGSILLTAEGEEISIPVKMSVEASGVPSVAIEKVTDVGTTRAKATGTLLEVGDSEVSKMGFCWSSTEELPDLSDESSNLGDAEKVTSFSGEITGLTPGTQYYIRAYATNSYGTSYSDETLTFTTATVDDDGGSSSSIAVPQGLTSYYTFDNEDANDATENELHGDLLNSPSFTAETPNSSGKALTLKGIQNQYMNIPHNAFKNLYKISACFWIKDFSIGTIFAAINSSQPLPYDFPRLVANDTEKFQFFGRHDYSNGQYVPEFNFPYTSIQNDGWHHVAVTMADINQNDIEIKLYVDGTLKATDTDKINLKSEGTQVQIGGNHEGKIDASMTTMKIDNIRFYQRCITAKEIKEIYESEK